MNKEIKLKIYVFILIILLIVATFYSLKFYEDYMHAKEYRKIIKNESSFDTKDWMTVPMIIKHRNISQQFVCDEFNLTYPCLNSQSTVKELCKKNNLNCSNVINEINTKQK